MKKPQGLMRRTGEVTFEEFCDRIREDQKADLIDGVIYMASPENLDANDLFTWLLRLIGALVEGLTSSSVYLVFGFLKRYCEHCSHGRGCFPCDCSAAQGACPMSRRAPVLLLSPEEAQQLHCLAHARSSPQGLAFRARLVLLCAAPGSRQNQQVAAELGCDPDTVCKWRGRFAEHRLDGLHDLPRSGRPATFS